MGTFGMNVVHSMGESNNHRRDKRFPGERKTVTDTSAILAEIREMWLNLWKKTEILSRWHTLKKPFSDSKAL